MCLHRTHINARTHKHTHTHTHRSIYTDAGSQNTEVLFFKKLLQTISEIKEAGEKKQIFLKWPSNKGAENAHQTLQLGLMLESETLKLFSHFWKR